MRTPLSEARGLSMSIAQPMEATWILFQVLVYTKLLSLGFYNFQKLPSLQNHSLDPRAAIDLNPVRANQADEARLLNG